MAVDATAVIFSTAPFPISGPWHITQMALIIAFIICSREGLRGVETGEALAWWAQAMRHTAESKKHSLQTILMN